MYILIKRQDFKVYATCDNYAAIHKIIEADPNIEEKDLIISKELDMHIVSRITYVDDNCVYKNKEYWSQDLSVLTNILDNYGNHTIIDFMGLPIDKSRFELEWYNNRDAIAKIDGIAGEVEYNITVGNEFISLFREMCVITPLEKITPLQIAEKTANIIPLILTGSFKEAIVLIQQLDVDEFFTEERLNLFINMLKSADSIDYMS